MSTMLHYTLNHTDKVHSQFTLPSCVDLTSNHDGATTSESIYEAQLSEGRMKPTNQ